MPQTIFCANGCAGDKVEIPITAVRKSLPKKRKPREKGRDSCSRHSEISTQIGEISRKGRDSHYRRPEISTQIAEKRRSFNKIKKRTGKSALIVKRQNPASYLGGKGLFKKQKICKKSTEHYTVQAYF